MAGPLIFIVKCMGVYISLQKTYIQAGASKAGSGPGAIVAMGTPREFYWFFFEQFFAIDMLRVWKRQEPKPVLQVRPEWGDVLQKGLLRGLLQKVGGVIQKKGDTCPTWIPTVVYSMYEDKFNNF